MTHIATLSLSTGAATTDIECFDDGFVPLRGTKAASLGAAATVAGGWQLQRLRERVESEGRTSARALAEALGTDVIETRRIVESRLDKGLGRKRTLVFVLRDGGQRKFVFSSNRTDVDEVVRVVGDLLRERFRDGSH